MQNSVRAFYFNAKTLGQFKVDQQNEYTFPIYEYVTLSAASKSNRVALNTDFNVYGNPFYEEANALVHEFAISFNEILNVADIQLGRISEASASDYLTMDGIRMVFHTPIYLSFELYSGYKRFMEDNSFTDGNLVAGVGAMLNKVPQTGGSLYLEHENNLDDDYNLSLNFNFYRDFRFYLTPRFYVNLSEELIYGVLKNATVGVLVFPHSMLSVKLEGSRFDTSNSTLDFIFPYSFFMTDAIWEFSNSVEFTPVRIFSIFEKVSYDRYYYDTDSISNGVILETGVNFQSFLNNSVVSATYLYGTSYGGVFYGANLRTDINPIDQLSFGAMYGIIYFDKVTGELGYANNAELSSTYFLSKNLSIKLAGEYNYNDEIQNDLRGSFNIEYKYF